VVYGDGEQVMDCVYVNDVARVLVRALLVDHGVYDSVFEAGTGRPTTVNEIAEAVIAEVGSGTVEHAPMRPGEPGNSVVLGNPLTLEPLGPLGLTKLEDGLKPTVAYYR
jgi:UDP-glucose 4-epimerase